MHDSLKDVCVQFLMDVTRGVYIIQGVRHDFEQVLATSGLDLETQSLEVENLKERFASNVAASVRQHLIESEAGQMFQKQSDNCLVRAVTTLLTQSGLANVERSCDNHLIANGGQQSLLFELKEGPWRCWDLTLSCVKSGFESFILTSQDAEAEILPCSAASRVTRRAHVRLMTNEQFPQLSVEVLDLQSDVDLQDELGRPVPLPTADGKAYGRIELMATISRASSLIRSVPMRCAMRCAARRARAAASFTTWAALSSWSTEMSEGQLPLHTARRAQADGTTIELQERSSMR